MTGSGAAGRQMSCGEGAERLPVPAAPRSRAAGIVELDDDPVAPAWVTSPAGLAQRNRYVALVAPRLLAVSSTSIAPGAAIGAVNSM